LFLAVFLLAGCTCSEPKKDAPSSTTTTAAPGSPNGEAVWGGTPAPEQVAKVLNLYIWAEYTSPELLAQFTEKTGIRVVESNYASNEELLAKLQAGASGYDLAVPSDYMVAVMAKLGLVRELDKAKIPNAANVDPSFLAKSFDAANKYSLPYAFSITGLAVNKELYKDEVTSWSDLLANEKLKGKVSVLDDVREAMAAALKLNGASLNSVNETDLAKAKATLIAAKAGIKAFNSTPADLLTSGEVAVAQMYAQEAQLARKETGKDIGFVIPKEGATLAIDNMVVLKDAKNADEAHAFINFMLDAAVHAAYVERTMAGPIVKGVPGFAPPADVLSRCEMMEDLGDKATEYDRIWAEIKAASH